MGLLRSKSFLILTAQPRLKTAELLTTLAESDLYQLLGHSSVAQYAERAFQICRSETLEMLRVAREVDRLPRLREGFESSRVSWSSLKEITRVASPSPPNPHRWPAGRPNVSPT